MKNLRIKINFELPTRYENVVWKIYAYLKGNPKIINKKEGDKIFQKDVFQYCVDLAMDILNLDFNKADLDVEFVPQKISPEEKLTRKMEDNTEFRTEEYRIAGKLESKLLSEYEDTYKPKGLSLQEFIKFKELDL